MKRNEWVFHIPVADILKAAEGKLVFHSGRVEWWKNKKAEVMDKIREDGIEVDDSLAADSPKFSSANYRRDTSVNIRADLQEDLSECVNKIRDHETKVRDYQSWCNVLAASRQAELDMHQDDYNFFFSGNVETR